MSSFFAPVPVYKRDLLSKKHIGKIWVSNGITQNNEQRKILTQWRLVLFFCKLLRVECLKVFAFTTKLVSGLSWRCVTVRRELWYFHDETLAHLSRDSICYPNEQCPGRGGPMEWLAKSAKLNLPECHL